MMMARMAEITITNGQTNLTTLVQMYDRCKNSISENPPTPGP